MLGSDHGAITLFELTRNGSNVEFKPLRSTVVLGPESFQSYENYYCYYIGVAATYNNIITSGFTGSAINNNDLFTTYMTQEWFGEWDVWNWSEIPDNWRFHSNSSSREHVEPAYFLPQFKYETEEHHRGIGSGLFVEGTGTIFVAREGEETGLKKIRAMFNPEPYSYPSSSGEYNGDEWIAGVVVENIDNPSGPSLYSDFTSVTTNLQIGFTSTIRLTPGFSGSAYDEHWKVWIDLNGDGDFDDMDEERFSGNGTGMLSGFMEVPWQAKPGPTRMRVSMQYNWPPPSSGTFYYGEVEDYTVYLERPDCGMT